MAEWLLLLLYITYVRTRQVGTPCGMDSLPHGEGATKRYTLTTSSSNNHKYTNEHSLIIGPFLGGAANGTKPPTARQSRPARENPTVNLA
jgi:hypothetical protein